MSPLPDPTDKPAQILSVQDIQEELSLGVGGCLCVSLKVLCCMMFSKHRLLSKALFKHSVAVAQSCPTLATPWTVARLQFLCPWDFQARILSGLSFIVGETKPEDVVLPTQSFQPHWGLRTCIHGTNRKLEMGESPNNSPSDLIGVARWCFWAG